MTIVEDLLTAAMTYAARAAERNEARHYFERGTTPLRPYPSTEAARYFAAERDLLEAARLCTGEAVHAELASKEEARTHD